MEKIISVPKVASNVTFIPQKLNDEIPTLNNAFKKRRVCGYARVSTSTEEQESSYEAQVDYYTNYIKANATWEFVGLYHDEGISGCNTKKRIGFQTMIKDALDGKIDLIVTKSISRFARNTVDALTNIRKLKEKGVEVFFEKEGIYTLDSKGELLISLLSSIAQEEARSISTNTRWGKMKSFADGKVYVGYKSFLGYDKGENGKMVVNKEEAKTIKLIYKLFLMGYSPYTIKKKLEKKHLKTPTGKDKWHTSTLLSIIQNEKYCGEAILQKQYTVDYLTKKQKKNEGELPQYYVKNDHEAIIDKQTFDFVQVELKKRLDVTKDGIYNRVASRYSGINIFSGKLVCGDCGAYYGRKVWHSNDKYRRIVYRCNRKLDNEKKCETMVVTEQDVKDLFVKEYNALDKEKAINNAKNIIEKLTDTIELDSKIKTASDNAKEILKQINDLVERNARMALNQKKVNAKNNELRDAYQKATDVVKNIEKEKQEKCDRRIMLITFINNLKEQALTIKEFDEGLFCALVDKILVFKDKMEIRWRGM